MQARIRFYALPKRLGAIVAGLVSPRSMATTHRKLAQPWYDHIDCRGREAMLAVTAGLSWLHEQGVAHLDMKTPNLLITADRRVKIADFGLGKLVSGPTSNTASQMGSFIWMAPELILRGTCNLASDVWSLSCIFWEVSKLIMLMHFVSKKVNLYANQCFVQESKVISNLHVLTPSSIERSRQISRPMPYPRSSSACMRYTDVWAVKAFGRSLCVVAVWVVKAISPLLWPLQCF